MLIPKSFLPWRAIKAVAFQYLEQHLTDHIRVTAFRCAPTHKLEKAGVSSNHVQAIQFVTNVLVSSRDAFAQPNLVLCDDRIPIQFTLELERIAER
jgi:adenosine deaminase